MVQELVDKARLELLTRDGEPFNAPERVQRLADLIVDLCNELEFREKVSAAYKQALDGFNKKN